jgi:enoyl-CoA hydratase
MKFQTITMKKTGKKAVIMLNKPDMLNAVTKETLTELQMAVDSLDADSEIQVVIIGAEGTRAFSAGGNIKEELEMSEPDVEEWSEQGHRLTEAIENSNKIYIAALHGYTIGAGCEIACACDFRIAADNVLISAPAIKLGMICGFGGNVRLPKLIGVTKAKEILLLGRSMDAEEAYRTGFLNQIVSRESLIDAAFTFADELTGMSPMALSFAKNAINYSMDATVKDAVRNETEFFTKAAKLEDRKEGMRAFLEKRKPKFVGK